MRSISFDTDIEEIPLPDEMPAPARISEDQKLKAPGTFDSLLNQNQDLMNRLSVSLRRSMELETQLGQMIERNRYLELQAQTLHTEMSVMSERNRQIEAEFISIRDQRNAAEREYAELQMETTERLTRLSKTAMRLSRYHKRIKSIVRPSIDKMRAVFADERITFEVKLEENAELREKIQQFKKQLSDAYSRIQTQYTENETQRSLMVESYESKIAAYQAESTQLKKEFDEISSQQKDLLAKNELLNEKQALLENRALMAERKYSDYRTSNEIRTAELQNETIALRTEVQKLVVEKMSLEESLMSLNNTLTETAKAYDAMSERYTGLQMIWEESTNKLSSANDQIQSLQKLNRELSRNLSEKRKDAELLESKILKLEENSNQKIQALFDNIKGFKRDEGFPEVAHENGYVNKLESLLSELEIKP